MRFRATAHGPSLLFFLVLYYTPVGSVVNRFIQNFAAQILRPTRN